MKNEDINIIACNTIPENFICGIEEITPDFCRQYVTDLDIKKYIKDEYTLFVKEQITNNYIFNGAPIIISESGRLLSGIEVLISVILTKKNIQHFVSRNVPDACNATIDFHTKRHDVDELSIFQKFSDDPDGLKGNTNDINTAISIISCVKNGEFTTKKTSKNHVVDFYIANRKEFDAICMAINEIKFFDGNVGRLTHKSVLIAMIYILSHPHGIHINNADSMIKATDFILNLCEPDSYYNPHDEKNQPIEEYKRYMKEIKENNGAISYGSYNRKGMPKDNDHVYWIINTWNAWIKGKTLSLKPAPVESEKINYSTKIVDSIFTFIPPKPLYINKRKEISSELVPEYEIKLITPEIAEEMLQYNDFNRNLKNRTVIRYAEEMRSGGWKFNGETIKVSSEGQILDAQHRLRACIASGCNVWVILVNNIDPDAFDTYDKKKPNSIRNILAKEYGNKNISSAITLLCKISNNDANYRPTPSFIQKIITENEEIIDHIDRYKEINSEIFNYNILAILYYLFSQSNEYQANIFMNKLLSLEVDDDFLFLNTAITQFKKRNMYAPKKIIEQGVICMIIDFWNDIYNGKDIVKNKYNKYQIPSGSKYKKIEGLNYLED